MTAEDIIAHFGLAAHPEGGWYRETWRAEAEGDARPSGTAILFLLAAGQHSHWHRVDAVEIWHFHAGAPLELRIAADSDGPARAYHLGIDFGTGRHPQVIVPAHHWQSARSLGAWTLVGCTVSPGFSFDGFELAPPGFDIPTA
jgi:predicted cupin superfamily sugar epimerase